MLEEVISYNTAIQIQNQIPKATNYGFTEKKLAGEKSIFLIQKGPIKTLTVNEALNLFKISLKYKIYKKHWIASTGEKKNNLYKEGDYGITPIKAIENYIVKYIIGTI